MLKTIRLTVLTTVLGLVILSVGLAGVFGRGGPVGLVGALAVALVLAGGTGWWLARRVTEGWGRLANRLTAGRRAPDVTLAIAPPIADPVERQAFEEADGALRDLAQTREQLHHFSARVAHELRAPITLLQLQIDYAGSKLDPTLVDGLKTQIKRLTEFVDTALLVARADQGNLPLAKEDRDLTALVTELLQPFELRAKSHRRTLCARVGPTRLFSVDPKIFALIFNNLMSNAFYHGAGEVRVRLAGDGAPTLSIVNRVRRKADGPLSNEAGTGMGLKTVRLLADGHGGMHVETRARLGHFVAHIHFL